jgi:hypothetical protein
VEQDERPRPFGIRRGEQRGRAASLVRSEDHGLVRAGRIEHGAEVLHSRLERGELPAVIGEAGASLVEQDQPERSGQPPVEVAPARIAPDVAEVRHVVRHVDEVGLPVADDLVGDRDAAGAGIARLRLHPRSLP